MILSKLGGFGFIGLDLVFVLCGFKINIDPQLIPYLNALFIFKII